MLHERKGREQPTGKASGRGTEPGGVYLAWPTLVNTRGEGTSADSGNGERTNTCRDIGAAAVPRSKHGVMLRQSAHAVLHPGLKAEMLPCDGAEAAAQQTVRAENID